VRLWLAGEQGNAVCYDEQGNRIPEYAEVVHALRQSDAREEQLRALTEEAVKARQDAEARVAAEAQAREGLAARLQEMEAELRRLQGPQ
jgi:colicin import membrane protein